MVVRRIKNYCLSDTEPEIKVVGTFDFYQSSQMS